MNADDSVILSPCSVALQQLLSILSRYGADIYVRFNVQRNKVVSIKCKEDFFKKYFLSQWRVLQSVCTVNMELLPAGSKLILA